jgi:purine-binding chemotaxis protein CheW
MSNTEINSATNLTQELPPEVEGAIQYLVCALAGREYGLRLDTLQEVLRFNHTSVAPVPNTPGWLEGILSLRGTIISVVNLRAFLGLPPDEENLIRAGQAEFFGIGAVVPRLLVLHSGELVAGVIVDDIRGVLFVKPEEVRPAPPAGSTIDSYLEGVYLDPKTDKLTWLLDTGSLLTSPDMLVFEPAGL